MSGKRVLVVGNGGREHALCWALARAESVESVECIPGNPLIRSIADCPEVEATNSSIVDYASTQEFDFVVVGPEAFLASGLADQLEAAGVATFGPSQAAAQLESSKNFAKQIMEKASVPTARYQVFNTKEASASYARELGFPCVLKMDGLAAGKGVSICQDEEELERELTRLFDSLSAKEVLVEEFLEGMELSFIVLTDGERVFPLSPAHDYKRALENDQGPNTGGMGTVAPSPRATPEIERLAMEQVVFPTLKALQNEGIPYKGFLYAGLMIAPDGSVRVLEFNARMGDPEAQVMLPLLENDFGEVISALLSGSDLPDRAVSARSAVNVVLASKGYPVTSSKGDVIAGIPAATQKDATLVFAAGVGENADGDFVTAGGRVLSVVGFADNISEARETAYSSVRYISFEGMQLRSDIGAE